VEQLLALAAETGGALGHDASALGQSDLLAEIRLATLAEFALVALRDVGCIEIVRVWVERNLYVIAGVALGIALLQLFVIYLAKTLEGQIDLQKSRWS